MLRTIEIHYHIPFKFNLQLNTNFLGCVLQLYINIFIASEKESWTLIDAKGKLPEARSSASLVCVGNKLYLYGGLNQDSGWLDNLHMFDTGK